MNAKDAMMADLRHLSLERTAVRLMREDISGIEEDIKKELPALQREALVKERERLLSSLATTERHIRRMERLLSLLSSEEREVLERTIIDPYPEVIFDLTAEMNCETTRIYRIRARALDRLIRLRYGAGA